MSGKNGQHETIVKLDVMGFGEKGAFSTPQFPFPELHACVVAPPFYLVAQISSFFLVASENA